MLELLFPSHTIYELYTSFFLRNLPHLKIDWRKGMIVELKAYVCPFTWLFMFTCAFCGNDFKNDFFEFSFGVSVYLYQ